MGLTSEKEKPDPVFKYHRCCVCEKNTNIIINGLTILGLGYTICTACAASFYSKFGPGLALPLDSQILHFFYAVGNISGTEEGTNSKE